MCGFPEYITSTPPRRYLRWTPSGTQTRRAYFTATCEGAFSENIVSWAGACVVNPATCLISAVATSSSSAGGSTTRCDLNASPILTPSLGGIGTSTIDATSETNVADGSCVNTGTDVSRIDSGTAVGILDDEDTEESASTRHAGDPETWPETVCNDAISFYTPRASVDFSYSRVQTRAKVGGVAGHTYKVTIRFAERPLGGGGPFVEFTRLTEIEVTVDGDPETDDWTDWVDVPLEEGLEIRASSCSVEEVG